MAQSDEPIASTARASGARNIRIYSIRQRAMTTTAILLCHMTALPDGDARGVDPLGAGQDSILLVRQGASVYGYRDLCPHFGVTPLPWRRHAYLNHARDMIVCAAHGALFRIDDGVCVSGPCLGQALTPVQLDIRADGAVYLLTAP